MSLRECLSPDMAGSWCTPQLCCWRQDAASWVGEEYEMNVRWALAVAEACETLAEESERAVARRLADGWHGTGQQLVTTARQVAG